MRDIVAAGEVLVDFIPAGTGETGYPRYEANPGGAPANCLSVCSLLGARAAFIGMVGGDPFGDFLIGALDRAGIDSRGVARTGRAPTTLAFVHLDAGGERRFSFVRNPGADTLLRAEDIDFSLIDRCRLFHFGSLSLTHEPSRSAVLEAAAYARKRGKIVSFDPNYRPLLWTDPREAVEWMRRGCAYADIVKFSEEELILICSGASFGRGCAPSTRDLADCARSLLASPDAVILVTAGPEGAWCFSCGEGIHSPGIPVAAVDTTGCGDAFLGAFLYAYLREPSLTIAEKLRFAACAGSFWATRRGGFAGGSPADREGILALFGAERG